MDVSTNVDALLQSAMAESREGNFLALAQRPDRAHAGDRPRARGRLLAGGRRAVVAGIRREVQQPARDAASSASFAGVQITPAQIGIALRPRLLNREIVDHLVSRARAGRSTCRSRSSGRR